MINNARKPTLNEIRSERHRKKNECPNTTEDAENEKARPDGRERCDHLVLALVHHLRGLSFSLFFLAGFALLLGLSFALALL
jgi:hypothetical protein